MIEPNTSEAGAQQYLPLHPQQPTSELTHDLGVPGPALVVCKGQFENKTNFPKQFYYGYLLSKTQTLDPSYF